MSTGLTWESEAILIVDDQAMMRDLVATICNRLGYSEVYSADTGERALRFMRDTKIWLVLCDWNMTPMTGVDLLRAIRSDESLSDTKFIMMTTQSHISAVVAAKRAGVDGYILKPFSPHALADAIASIR